MEVRKLQLCKKYTKETTFFVLKLDKSNLVKGHPSNMLFIFVIWEVSNLDTSKEVKDLQDENMNFVLLTLLVIKLETSNDFNLVQELNI